MEREEIQFKKIDKTSAPQITFSKRRREIFKKAKELSVLCDADVALIIFSSTGKLFDFASSSMKKILEKHDLHKRNIEKLEQPSLDFQLDEDRNCSKLSTEVVERSHQLRCNRGEELQELSIEELQKLERSLEIELSNVRKIKDEKIMKEINQLKQKGMQLMEENEHLELQVEISKDNKTTVASDSENIVEDDGEEGQSSKSVTNALNTKDSDHSYTSLKLG
ncbi:MADS-box protein JOINTLESS-like isoform X2 [Olea europaea var. sylvestris]|uniref:MADS-box protein JOINTLESS-like isoform X2 n=1 Tax=Olea europaea var. sylvestris TaxID=158386 RepID=UPI000C1CFD61|nr:MADS-box protein JOINTLESS-like isoform X2 [Olea europaea var. sylvestris]